MLIVYKHFQGSIKFYNTRFLFIYYSHVEMAHGLPGSPSSIPLRCSISPHGFLPLGVIFTLHGPFLNYFLLFMAFYMPYLTPTVLSPDLLSWISLFSIIYQLFLVTYAVKTHAQHFLNCFCSPPKPFVLLSPLMILYMLFNPRPLNSRCWFSMISQSAILHVRLNVSRVLLSTGST